jgi:hypothetical protein
MMEECIVTKKLALPTCAILIVIAATTANANYELFKVDLVCNEIPPTIKSGWTTWNIANACDGTSHDGRQITNIAQTGIDAYISCDGGSGGNLRSGYGEAICNTSYQWHSSRNIKGSSNTYRFPGAPAANVILKLSGKALTAGEYWLYSYHNFPAQMMNMPSIKAIGEGVKQLEDVTDIKIQNVHSDKDLVPSVLKFKTDGSGPVTIIYEAAHKGKIAFETGTSSNAVLNAFKLVAVDTPNYATNPSPADASENLSPNLVLSWAPGKDTTQHDVYLGTDKAAVENATPSSSQYKERISVTSYTAAKLQYGQTYYWRVDEITADNISKSDVWSFTIYDAKASKPSPANNRHYVPTDATLSWNSSAFATAHNVYFGVKIDDVADNAKPVSVNQEINSFNPGKLKQNTDYYWRIDEVIPGEIIKGDIWTFRATGKISLKVDLALPIAEGVYFPNTAKPGWTIMAPMAWGDMYSHDGKWLNNIDNSGVNVRLSIGNEGMGSLKVKGLRMHSKAGEAYPTGLPPKEDPICNTWYQSADWATYGRGEYQNAGNTLLTFTNLPAGEYTLYSYHNHWYHCDRFECTCLGMVYYRGNYPATRAEQGPMPSITANPLPSKPLPGYFRWSQPKGTDKGVTPIENAYYFEAQHVSSDDELVPSVVRFKTDGSPVLIIYDTPKDYYDYRDYPGARAVFNAFRLEQQ